jgi:hypothetical protein
MHQDEQLAVMDPAEYLTGWKYGTLDPSQKQKCFSQFSQELCPTRIMSTAPIVRDYYRNNWDMLLGANFGAQRLRKPFSKLYPLLNFSETLVLFSEIGKFPYDTIRTLSADGLYPLFKTLENVGYNRINKQGRIIPTESKNRIRKMDVYHKKNLHERLEAAGEGIAEEICDMMRPGKDFCFARSMPLRKRRGKGNEYALNDARDISGVIKAFPQWYNPDFL